MSINLYINSVNSCYNYLISNELEADSEKIEGRGPRSAITGQVPSTQAPATEATLEIPGVSILVQGNMAFPVGHALPQGQPGDISDYTPSEAFGYAMRNAVLARDKTAFQQLMNGYLYLVNQTTLYRQNEQGMSGSQLAQGLIGWSPNIVNITNGQPPYPSDIGSQFVSSASDADTDIINSLIMACEQWPGLTAADDLTPAGEGIISSTSTLGLVSTAISSFVNNELGNFTFNGTNYYALTLDNWGHDMVYPDYFDPTAFAKMIAIVGENSLEGQSLIAAAQGTMNFITAVASANGNWIPDSPYSLSGASSFGYDATRILMRFGQYLALESDPLNMKDQVASVLQNLVNNIFSNNGQYLSWQSEGTVTFTPSGLTGGAFTGPLTTSLKSLNVSGQLPSDVTQSDISQAVECLDYDLTQYDISSMEAWQNWYFSIELALLNQGLQEQYSPAEVEKDDLDVISLTSSVARRIEEIDLSSEYEEGREISLKDSQPLLRPRVASAKTLPPQKRSCVSKISSVFRSFCPIGKKN